MSWPLLTVVETAACFTRMFLKLWPQENLLHRAELARVLMQDKFIKHYDMEFGPCKAGGEHIWTCEYPMPETSSEQIAEYVRTLP
jgi:hypothetical protein